jgi:hypothetical protein
LYAFQAGNAGECRSQMAAKGAIPIAYDEAANHKVLWDTLEAWAERAKNRMPGSKNHYHVAEGS